MSGREDAISYKQPQSGSDNGLGNVCKGCRKEWVRHPGDLCAHCQPPKPSREPAWRPRQRRAK